LKYFKIRAAGVPRRTQTNYLNIWIVAHGFQAPAKDRYWSAPPSSPL
jgi:hypothetical protein